MKLEREALVPLHHQVRKMLDKAAATLPPLHEMPLDLLRQVHEVRARFAAQEVADVRDTVLPGPSGDLRIRAYTPLGSGPFPMMMFFHGGGWTVCSIESHDILCRQLCAGAGCVVLSVDYRLAPDSPFPAASDDCLAATRWASQRAGAFRATPDGLIVAGDSSGGNLAVVTSLRLRDEGGPPLAAQLLFYPVLDVSEMSRLSASAYAVGFGLTTALMDRFVGLYLPDRALACHPHVSPLRAESFAGLPPAFIGLPEFDILRDGGEAYGKRLQSEGILAQVHLWRGMNHGFIQWPDRLDTARLAIDEACAWLRAMFAR